MIDSSKSTGVAFAEVHNKIFGRSFNLWDPKEDEDFERAGAHTEKCPTAAGNVAMWVAEVLLDEYGKVSTR